VRLEGKKRHRWRGFTRLREERRARGLGCQPRRLAAPRSRRR
jgi:hypothetical protein